MGCDAVPVVNNVPEERTASIFITYILKMEMIR
jgi:hypothetical protein